MKLSPLSLSLRQLQYAVAVADTLSFRAAAERCHVAQPSLSAQLAQLEDSLGVRLFERDRRRVLPTTAGRDLVERARRVLREADDLVEAAARAGTLDAALLALEAAIGEVEREVIARDPFVLATPPRHPLGAAASPARLSDLREAPVLLLDDGHCFRDQVLAVCSRARVREAEFRATSLSTLAQMVAGGAGVTLLPKLAVPTESARGGLRVRAFAEPAPHRTIGLVWRRRSPLAPALRQVAATIRAAYPKETR